MKVAKKILRYVKRLKEGSAFGYTQLKIEPDQFTAAAKAIERLIAKGTKGCRGVSFISQNSQYLGSYVHVRRKY